MAKNVGITLGHDEIKTRDVISDEVLNKMTERIGKVLVLNPLFYLKCGMG